MRDAHKLRDLLERVSAASGPDDDLDADLCVTLQWVGYLGDGIRDIRRSDDQGWIDYEDAEGECTDMVPALTASLDASIALVERMLPSAIWLKKDQRVATVAIPSLDPKGWAVHHDGAGATFPLAILSALLRALISQAEGEGNA